MSREGNFCFVGVSRVLHDLLSNNNNNTEISPDSILIVILAERLHMVSYARM